MTPALVKAINNLLSTIEAMRFEPPTEEDETQYGPFIGGRSNFVVTGHDETGYIVEWPNLAICAEALQKEMQSVSYTSFKGKGKR